jgi:hypothetical protein
MPAVVPTASTSFCPSVRLLGLGWQVVDHRSPHRSGEAAAGVEDRADNRTEAVEDNLRKEEPREHRGEIPLLGLQPMAVERHDLRCQQDAHDGHDGQRREDDRHQPLRIAVAVAVVIVRGLDEQGNHDAAEDAAEQQVVKDVGDRVGDVVAVAHGQPHRGGDDDRPQEAGAAGRQCPDGHRHSGPREARLAHALLRVARRAVRARRARRTATVSSSIAVAPPVMRIAVEP